MYFPICRENFSKIVEFRVVLDRIFHIQSWTKYVELLQKSSKIILPLPFYHHYNNSRPLLPNFNVATSLGLALANPSSPCNIEIGGKG